MVKENIVVKKDCHSRGMLSGISHIRFHKWAQLFKQAEDPRLQISGRIALWYPPSSGLRPPSPSRGEGNRGFTLIELLVVVLIIGILAAVALPQYQRAVDKARAAGAIHMLTQIAKAESLHYLEYGEFTQSFHDLDIGIPGIKSDQPNAANSNDFVFTIVQIATSGEFVQVWASASDSAGNLLQGDNEYHLDFTIYADGTVRRTCRHGNTLNGGKCQFIATGDEWTKTE